MLPYGVGVVPNPIMIVGVIRHEQAGLLVDPRLGVLYGAQGQPVGTPGGDGYVRVGRRRNSLHQYAHRIVWEAVHGPIPDGYQVDHLNGVKHDNRIANLDAVTQSENARRAIAMGLAPVGEARSDSKLTAELVRQIRRTTKAGQKTVAQWARELGVDRATIRSARDGTTWRHVACRGRLRGGLGTTFGGHHPGKSRRRPK